MSYFPIVIRKSKNRFLNRAAFTFVEHPEDLPTDCNFRVVKTGVDRSVFEAAMDIVFGNIVDDDVDD